MDKKSKILLWVFGTLIAISVGVTYWRIMIKKDYIIEAEADCDPATETCFVYECDPEAEECTGDPVEDTSYYKLIRRNAANIPLCDPADENCEALTCLEGEAECEIVLCDDETKTDEDICNDPAQYVLDNPIEEEAVECEEGDEECLAAQEEIVCEEGEAACLNEKERLEGKEESENPSANTEIETLETGNLKDESEI